MEVPETETSTLSSVVPIAGESIRCIAIDDDDYPPALLDLSHPPRELFALGRLTTLTPPIVAIVGTRDATDYGIRVTRELAGALARAGACVVSGLARGIDAAAHRATLAESGKTIAVLGTGVDIPYPVGHRELHANIARKGLLLSEFPPGSRASKGSFPRRNRILAALASVTIVVEAPASSGALLTAGHALELGRVVAAVPGPIDAAQSAGTNELLRDGAVVIACVDDALALVGVSAPRTRSDNGLTTVERVILRELHRASADIDALATRTRLPARECMQALTTLELAGRVECLLTGEIRAR